MATRKVRKATTKRKKSRKPNGLLSGFLGWGAFIALGYAAIAGWWPHLIQGVESKQTAQNRGVLSAPAPSRLSSQTLTTIEPNTSTGSPQMAKRPPPLVKGQDDIRDLIAVGSITPSRLLNPPAVARPQVKPQPPMMAKALLPSVPYQEDSSLPPEGQFGVDNAAYKVVAKDVVYVFAEKNSTSKIIATLPKGQEMRVYEKNGNWQRIVVPSSDIIGWVTEKDVTKNN